MNNFLKIKIISNFKQKFKLNYINFEALIIDNSQNRNLNSNTFKREQNEIKTLKITHFFYRSKIKLKNDLNKDLIEIGPKTSFKNFIYPALAILLLKFQIE